MKLVTTALLTTAVAATTATTLEHDRTHQLPSGWKLVGETPRETTLFELAFAVKQQNKHLLEESLLRTSNPDHSDYGKHLTSEQVHQMIAPLQADVDLVMAHFAQHNIKAECVTSNCDWIVAKSVSVTDAEALVGGGAKYQELHHEDGHVIHRLRTKGYQLPANLAAAVDLVAPTTHVPTIRATAQKIKPASPDGFVNVPSVLRAQYSLTDADVGASTGRKQAVTGFLGQTFSESSLAAFYKELCNGTIPCGQEKDATKVVCHGDKCAGGGGMESMLDIEYINAMGAGVDTEFWGFSGNNPYDKQQVKILLIQVVLRFFLFFKIAHNVFSLLFLFFCCAAGAFHEVAVLGRKRHRC